jgi:hypothetical protein
MANEAAKSLQWARERLEYYYREFIKWEGQLPIMDENPRVALINLDATKADVLDEEGKITIRGQKSRSWAESTMNLMQYRIPADPGDPFPLDYYSRFKNGETDALIDFCRHTPSAIFYPWVAREIYRLRTLNTKESRENIAAIFNAYSSDGARKFSTYGEELKEYWNGYQSFKNRPDWVYRMQKTLRGQRDLRGQGEWNNYKVIEKDGTATFKKSLEEYWDQEFSYFSKSNFNKNMKILHEIAHLVDSYTFWMGAYIGRFCGDYNKHKEIDELREFIHPTIESTFLKIDQIGEEIRLYKRVRDRFYGQEIYQKRNQYPEDILNNFPWLRTDPNPSRSGLHNLYVDENKKPENFDETPATRLKNALTEVCADSKVRKSHEELKALYGKYRIIEALVNRDIIAGWGDKALTEDVGGGNTDSENSDDNDGNTFNFILDNGYIKREKVAILKADGFYEA